jgi:hypothetical protein
MSPDREPAAVDVRTGRWWRQRHVHVPVALWVAASVLAGAAIGAALEPDGGDEAPVTTEPTTSERASDAAATTTTAAATD